MPDPTRMGMSAWQTMRARVRSLPWRPEDWAEGVGFRGQGRLRPFAWRSLEALDTAVDDALAHAVGTDGLQASTRAWMARAYRSLRRHVEPTRTQRAFLSGDLERQVPVLESWVQDMRARGLGYTAVNGMWRAARGLLRRVGRRSNRLNPFDYCPAPPPGRSEPRWLSRPEAERVLVWVANAPWPSALERTRNLLIVGLMLFAGLRRGEVVRLRYGDINLDQGVIHIVKGKGRNGGKDRPAYMPPQLRQFARAYLAERHRAGWTDPALFFGTGRKAPLGPTGVARLFQRISRESGVSVHPHALRHSFVTLCALQGVPSRVIQTLAGHASLSMVEHYSHVVSREARDAAERIALDVRLPGDGPEGGVEWWDVPTEGGAGQSALSCPRPTREGSPPSS